jgi:hypothetical protein
LIRQERANWIAKEIDGNLYLKLGNCFLENTGKFRQGFSYWNVWEVKNRREERG